MDDLVRWFGKQLDEDERIAKAAADGDSGEWFVGDKWNVYRAENETPQDDVETNELVVYGNVKPQSEHIAEHDPARVLREIEAKRAVVARYEFTCREASRVVLAEDERETWIRVGGALQSVVIQLAAPYADRPGYKAEEWSP